MVLDKWILRLKVLSRSISSVPRTTRFAHGTVMDECETGRLTS